MYFIPHRENNDIITNNKFLRHDHDQFKLNIKNLLNKISPRSII